MSQPDSKTHRPGLAFLLAQIGAHAAGRFGERISPLGLTPPHAGILWMLSREPNVTQRALAGLLGAFPSRLVLLLDELEKQGLVERRARRNNRRAHALRLTAAGTAQLKALGQVAREHQQDLCASLSEAERGQLQELLEKIAAQQKLRPGVHPGYRRLK